MIGSISKNIEVAILTRGHPKIEKDNKLKIYISDTTEYIYLDKIDLT